MNENLFPKEMRCPQCNALLILDKDEKESGELTCPECNKHILHSETPNPINRESIYCPLCRNDYPLSKKTCSNCGAKNTFEEPEETTEEYFDNTVMVDAVEEFRPVDAHHEICPALYMPSRPFDGLRLRASRTVSEGAVREGVVI